LTRAIAYAGTSLDYAEWIEHGEATGKSDTQEMNEWYKQAGYHLGLALHYVTDLSQPMHAANFINWPLPPSPDWRHSGFEKVAEAKIGNYILSPSEVIADQINPDALGCKDMRDVVIALAGKQKSVYDTKLKPLLNEKVYVYGSTITFDSNFTVQECDPIFRTALPAGQLYCAAFLLAWGRERRGNNKSITQITDLLLTE